MVMMLCFVLDLRCLSPIVLRDLKQSLLQLANYYAVSCLKSFGGNRANSKPLPDRIGLCYVVRNRVSGLDELKIAYNPHGNFNLRDFHHALNNLPADAFFPESTDAGALCKDLKLADVLSEKIVYSWGPQDKNVAKKVILISSILVGTVDSVTVKALKDAADNCVTVEFILLEQPSSDLGDVNENINHFLMQIGSLKNCSFQTCPPDLQVLYGLSKNWLLDIKDDKEEPLQARFIFKNNLMSTQNEISCNLYTSFNPIIDEFVLCQTCRCHGIPLDHSNMNEAKSSASCPVTKCDLGPLDIIENSLRVGEQTILHMPSFQDSPKVKQVSSPIYFNVIQRTNLGSLSEGLITGATYFVTPHDSDDKDKSELNSQLFQVVCSALNSLDQGLVCCSNCNIETARGTSFPCYYILLPSDKRLMLLRRLSAAEESLPLPGTSQIINSVAVEIENTVHTSLLKIEVSDYNPLQHERGLHKKLNLLVKQSLQFGAILPSSKEEISESDMDQKTSEDQPKQPTGKVVTEDEHPKFDSKLGEKKIGPSLTEEWEKLIVTELGDMPSPTCISSSKLDQPVISPSQNNRQIDEKTSRILERLEVPRQLKRKAVSPTISSSLSTDVCISAKKPLIPYRPGEAADQGQMLSQLIKPSFQRMKKKR